MTLLGPGSVEHLAGDERANHVRLRQERDERLAGVVADVDERLGQRPGLLLADVDPGAVHEVHVPEGSDEHEHHADLRVPGQGGPGESLRSNLAGGFLRVVPGHEIRLSLVEIFVRVNVREFSRHAFTRFGG